MSILLYALVIVALVVPILIGFLLGSVRGLRRSIIRLVLVALSIVLAFVLRGTITDQIMNFQVDGQPLGDYIVSELSAVFQGINIPADVVQNLVSLLVLAVAFLLSLSLFLFVTWLIIFPICKLFIRNKKSKDGDGKHKKHKKHNGLSRLTGSILGLVQGVAVAVVCVTVLNGLFFNLSNVVATMNDTGNNEETVATYSEDPNEEKAEKFLKSLIDYKDSGIRGFINKMGGDALFDKIVSIEVEEGKTVTLTGQINALTGVVNMGKELTKLQDLDMVGGLSDTTATELKNIFDKLDEINSNLSDESKDTINELVKAVAGSMMPDMGINFKTVDFHKEGQVIADLSAYKETDMSNLSSEESKQKAKEIVETVMKSDIILPLLSASGEFTIGLEGDNYEFTKNYIEELEQQPDSDKSKVDMLKNFFGLNNEQQPN